MIKQPPLLNPPRQDTMPEWARPTEEDKRLVRGWLRVFRGDKLQDSQLCFLFENGYGIFPDLVPTEDDIKIMTSTFPFSPHNSEKYLDAGIKSGLKRIGIHLPLNEEENEAVERMLSHAKKVRDGETTVEMLEIQKIYGIKTVLDKKEQELLDLHIIQTRAKHSAYETAKMHILQRHLGKQPKPTKTDLELMQKTLEKARKGEHHREVMKILKAMHMIYQEKEGEKTPQMPPLKEVTV